MLKGIIPIALSVLIGITVATGVYGCKKNETSTEENLQKKLVSLEGKSYEHCKIAFVSKRNGNNEIYTMNPDGSEQTRLTELTDNLMGDSTPIWSPDGEKIIFYRDHKSNEANSINKINSEIYVMNSDGSEQKRLTNNSTMVLEPHWSPDGKHISFVSGEYVIQKNGQVILDLQTNIMNSDGSKQKRLTNNSAINYTHYWSPDGKKISFTSIKDSNERNAEVCIMNADGSEQKNLTNNSVFDIGSSWSPDGRKIAFISARDGNWEIYVMNNKGSEQTRLTNNPLIDTLPLWSPDGKKLVFGRLQRSKEAEGLKRNDEIYIMNSDGSEEKRLTNGLLFQSSWSPDGKKIVFVSGRDGNREIYIMNPDGSDQKNLTNNPGADFEPSWSPFLASKK